jgi:hypothetical protein
LFHFCNFSRSFINHFLGFVIDTFLEQQLEVSDDFRLRFLLGWTEYMSGLTDPGLANMRKAAAAAPPQMEPLRQYVDVSMQEAMISYWQEQTPVTMWQKTKENNTRVGSMDAMVTPCGLYPCKDGWISLCVVTPQEWDALSQWIYEVTGNAEVLKDEYKGGLISRMPVRDMVNVLVMEFTDKLTGREIFLEGQRGK